MSKGFADAGFNVTGVDIDAQPSYPFAMRQADALEILADASFIKGFDAIHASPPCQAFTKLVNPATGRGTSPDLISAVRDALKATGKPYVIENVPQAPLINPVQLCGSSFGLRLRRHRKFEVNFPLVVPPCDHAWQNADPLYRNGKYHDWQWSGIVHSDFQTLDVIDGDLFRDAFEIDWMRVREMRQAIPPVFAEYIGNRLWRHLRDMEREPTSAVSS